MMAHVYVHCYVLLKLRPLSSCPCGGVFHHVLRVMAGVLLVVGVYPSKLEATLNLEPNLTGWFWSKRKRHLSMRVALRGERFPESDDTWVAAWVGSLLWAIHFKDGYCQGKLLVGADWQCARGCIGGELCIVFWRYSC